MAELSDRARTLLGYLPAVYGLDDPDPIVVRWMEAMADEVERIFWIVGMLRATSAPSRASDAIGTLARWEETLRLPVAPAELTEEQRQARVLARFAGRVVRKGYQWHAAMRAAIGSDDWTVERNTPDGNMLTITLPFLPATTSFEVVRALGEEITAANQEIVWASEAGFIVGRSAVGDAL